MTRTMKNQVGQEEEVLTESWSEKTTIVSKEKTDHVLMSTAGIKTAMSVHVQRQLNASFAAKQLARLAEHKKDMPIMQTTAFTYAELLNQHSVNAAWMILIKPSSSFVLLEGRFSHHL